MKNAFDADATVCRIEFGEGQIVVSDNGNGMTDDDFAKHWMRIATTHKVDQRTSPRFKRALTGSKGIGRLSAQTGCHLETVRYYERIGLLAKPSRTAGGHRVYGAAAVSRLAS